MTHVRTLSRGKWHKGFQELRSARLVRPLDSEHLLPTMRVHSHHVDANLVSSNDAPPSVSEFSDLYSRLGGGLNHSHIPPVGGVTIKYPLPIGSKNYEHP